MGGPGGGSGEPRGTQKWAFPVGVYENTLGFAKKEKKGSLGGPRGGSGEPREPQGWFEWARGWFGWAKGLPKVGVSKLGGSFWEPFLYTRPGVFQQKRKQGCKK